MKMLLALLAWPTVAAACDTGAIIQKYAWILSTAQTDTKLAEICNNEALKKEHVDGIKSLVNECIPSDTKLQKSLQPIFDIIGDVMCSTGTSTADANKEEFCLPSLARMVPLTRILTGVASGTLDLSAIDVEAQLRDNELLADICRTNTCAPVLARMTTRAVKKAMARSGLSSNFLISIIKSAGAACVTDKDGEKCALKQYKTVSGKVDATVACKDNQMAPCARKVLSVLGVGEDFSVAGLCGGLALDQQEVAQAVLVMQNVAIAYFNGNKKAVMAALKSDLGYNLGGLLPENLDLTITPNDADNTLTVEIKVNGDSQLKADIDIKMALNAFQKLLAAQEAVAPAMDTMPDFTIDNSMPSQAMKLESIVELDSIPGTTPDTTPADNQSSAARLGASAAVVLLAAVTAM